MKTPLASYTQMQAAGFPSGKAICPKCGEKTFVYFIDERTGELLPPEYGKCDRVYNCPTKDGGGYYNYPTDYFKNGNGARKASQTVTNIIPFTRPPAYVNRLPYSYVTKSLANINSDCNFIKYLIKIFDKEVTKFLIDKYLLGVDKHDDVIFWQIDAQNEVRAGKTIPYWPEGKRKKDGETEYELGWVHKKAKDENKALLYPNYKLEQCLYGEHLLSEAPTDAPILIFESEKTAVVGSIYAPFYFRNAVCLATGGLELLNAAKLEVLRGREITICPDGGATDKWNKKLKNSGLRYKIKEFSKVEKEDFVDTLELDEKGKALTLTDNLYTWPDGEVFDDFARNPIYIDFKYYKHHFINKEAPNADTVGALYS